MHALVQRWLRQRHFYAGVGIPCFFVFMLLFGGLKNIIIMVHGGRTTAIVTEIRHPDSGRGGTLAYSYVVDGHIYSGTGSPDHEPFTPPFTNGTAFQVRYSTWIPSLSSAQEDLTVIFGQFLVGSLFLLWADYMAVRHKRRTEKPAA